MKYAKWALVLALLGGVSFGAWHVTQATVSTTPPRNDYVGTGSVDAYDYTFRIFASSDLRVTTEDAAGVVTPLILTTDYTVTGANNPSGGTVTLVAGNLASGTTLTIRSDRTPQQATNLRNQGFFSASTHEAKFDELTRYAQQLRDVVSRSLHFPETEVGGDAATELPAASVRAGKFLAFDGSGNAITAAGTSGNLGPVSAYIDTLLDDANAATARTTLGAVNIAGDTITGGLTLQGIVSLDSGGLQFPASQIDSVNVNTLDDYEEFSWTPSLGGTATYSVQIGTGTKIGRLVCLNAKVTVNTIGTGSQTTFTGMPAAYLPTSSDAVFTVSNSANLAASVVSISGHTTGGGNTITLLSRTAAAAADAQTAVLGNGSFLSLAGCYQS